VGSCIGVPLAKASQYLTAQSHVRPKYQTWIA